MDALISAIIPVYNTPREYLDACIESLVTQTYANAEIILVDDGSRNETAVQCDELAKKYSTVRVIHQENKGPSIARSVGLRQIRGDYLTFVDSDDTLKSDAWESCVKKMEATKADCLVFGWIDNASGSPLNHRITEADSFYSAEEATIMIASDNEACGGGYPWNKFFRVKPIREANGGEIPEFDEALFTYEDKEWILRILQSLKTVVLIPDIYYDYRFVPASLTNSAESWYRRQYNAYEAYEKILSLLKDKNAEAYSGALNFYFGFGARDMYNQYRHPKDYGGLARGRKTKHWMYGLCKRIPLSSLRGKKRKLVWIVLRIVGAF